jgi:hypothetical protein
MAAIVNNAWYWLVGAPSLLLISLSGLYDHLSERSHRNEVLAHGTEAAGAGGKQIGNRVGRSSMG